MQTTISRKYGCIETWMTVASNVSGRVEGSRPADRFSYVWLVGRLVVGAGNNP